MSAPPPSRIQIGKPLHEEAANCAPSSPLSHRRSNSPHPRAGFHRLVPAASTSPWGSGSGSIAEAALGAFDVSGGGPCPTCTRGPGALRRPTPIPGAIHVGAEKERGRWDPEHVVAMKSLKLKVRVGRGGRRPYIGS